MLNYSSKHPGLIANVYHFFSGKLGYKNRNQIYRWFQDRDDSKIGLNDLKAIVNVTQDITPALVFFEECQAEIKRENNPNQLQLYK